MNTLIGVRSRAGLYCVMQCRDSLRLHFSIQIEGDYHYPNTEH